MQIRFNYETKYGTFSDALNLSDDHSYTDAEIESMKEQRRNNWIAYIDSTQIDVPVDDSGVIEYPSEPEV